MTFDEKVENLSVFINRGITPNYTENNKDSICVINQKCIRDYHVDLKPSRLHDFSKRKITQGKALEEYDVLINSTGVGTLGRVAQYFGKTGSATVDSHVTIVRPNPNVVDPIYFGYLLKNQQATIEGFAEGSTGQTELSRDSVKELVLTLVKGKNTQKKIGKGLLEIDNKITLNRQINQTLEAMAQALFKSWFVDFEPVKAKLSALAVGGSADDANLAAMSAISGKTTEQLLTLKTTHPDQFQQLHATADLFPSEMVDSELGEIPKGWEVKAFGDLLKKTIGGDWGKDEPDDKHTEQVKILRGTDLPKVFLGDDTGVPIRYVEAKKLKTRIIEAGDIVIEVSGGSKDQPTGRSLFVSQTLINRLKAQLEPASFCRLFKPLSEEIGVFLGIYLQKIYEEGKTWHYQNQSTGISNFQTNTFLEKELLVVPCTSLLDVFDIHASPILDKIYSSESNELITIRDALLPKLLSGELLVNEVGNET